MRILLVQPTTKYPNRKLLRSRTRWLLGITLPYLAGLTPRGIQVDLADDRLMDLPYHRQYDLVGITSTCATAERAYEIAAEFRRRGVPVVMGGFHVTLHPEEAMEHCDAVVVGEAESVWEQVLEDARVKRLQASLPGRGFSRPGRSAPAPPGVGGLPELPGQDPPHPDQPGLSVPLRLLRGAHRLRPHLSPAAHC